MHEIIIIIMVNYCKLYNDSFRNIYAVCCTLNYSIHSQPIQLNSTHSQQHSIA